MEVVIVEHRSMKAGGKNEGVCIYGLVYDSSMLEPVGEALPSRLFLLYDALLVAYSVDDERSTPFIVTSSIGSSPVDGPILDSDIS